MNRLLFPLMLLTLIHSTLFGDALEVGAEAPKLFATTHEGERIDLGAALRDGTSLVFFYPKAFTPGCTKQACSLRDSWSELEARGLRIFGVSSDSAKTQAEFRARHKLPFTLIADTDQAVAKAFGKNRWSRQAYIFREGKLVWRDLSAATANQAEEALAALDGLAKK